MPREGDHDQPDRGRGRWGPKTLETHLAQSQTLPLLSLSAAPPPPYSSLQLHSFSPILLFEWTFILRDHSNLYIFGWVSERISRPICFPAESGWSVLTRRESEFEWKNWKISTLDHIKHDMISNLRSTVKQPVITAQNDWTWLGVKHCELWAAQSTRPAK